MTSSHRFYVLRAWLVHLYTSLGLIAALIALQAIVAGNFNLVLLALGLALFIDTTDGPFARRWEVKKWVPAFSGRKLDDITDYINYTFLPVFFVYYNHLLPAGWDVVVLALVLLSSAYGFCQEAAKTDDGYFTGFPSYWNLVILYLYLLNLPPLVKAMALLFYVVLTWIPIKYVTFHTPYLRRPNFVLFLVYVGIWIFMLYQLVRFNQVNQPLLYVSLLFPFYHLLFSFYLFFTGRSRQQRAEPPTEV